MHHLSRLSRRKDPVKDRSGGDEVKAGLKEALEDYEYPVDIRVIEERPYFHFKTNRKELTEAILAENN